MRKGSGVWVWVCTASRKEKACSVYKKNKVERGCVVATVVARAAPGGAVRESSGVWVCNISVYPVVTPRPGEVLSELP